MNFIIGTKLRANLLSYLFSHPGESYYVRELAGLIQEDPGNLSRELRRYEAEGLLKHSFKGRVKLYSLDAEYPMFQELKKIVAKTEGLEAALRRLVASFDGIDFACIYGSYAKNKERKTSDIDLIVCGTVPRDAFTGKVRDLESHLNREINFTLYTRPEFDRERVREGSFLHLVLKGAITILKGSLHDR